MNRLNILIIASVVIWSFNVIFIIEIYTEPKPMQIYIAGKYSGTPEQIRYNVERAEAAGMQVADKCNYPLVPHLLGYMSNETHDYTYWTTLDYIGLEKSDGLFLISHSAGADKELELAKQLGKPIYYSIDEIPNRCK